MKEAQAAAACELGEGGESCHFRRNIERRSFVEEGFFSSHLFNGKKKPTRSIKRNKTKKAPISAEFLLGGLRHSFFFF